jgi:hypothetical protein
MRCVASVGWLLLMGCNRIFGISSTQPWDAPIPLDAIGDQPHVQFTWLYAQASASGTPAPVVPAPFAGADIPQIRIATIDGPFAPVAYISTTEAPGWVIVPRSYFERDGAGNLRTWRLEYTRHGPHAEGDGDLAPHEVQWAPEDKVGHLVVPIAGRIDRAGAPGGSGYDINATNLTSGNTAFKQPRVFTTGLWTDGAATPGASNASGTQASYDFAMNAVSLSGSLGDPSSPSDRAALVDFGQDAMGFTCRVAIGSAAFSGAALNMGGHTPVTATWDTRTEAVTAHAPEAAISTRLQMGLGMLSSMIDSQHSWLMYGYIPSAQFPGLTASASAPQVRLANVQLPVPVMATLLQCPQGPQTSGPNSMQTLPPTAKPFLNNYPVALHVQWVSNRLVAAPAITLYSGLETVVIGDSRGTPIPFPAKMPTLIKLATPTLGTIDLADNADQIAIGEPTGTFVLSFTPEADDGTGLRADYYDVVLHGFGSNGLTTVRTYTAFAPQVVIDGSVITAGADYVFEIRSYKGHPMAPRGDLSVIDYPYGSAVVFTRTFRAVKPAP